MAAHSYVHLLPKPACPSCGSREHVVRMASSVTPFEKPDPKFDTGAHWYCQTCAHDFEPIEEEI